MLDAIPRCEAACARCEGSIWSFGCECEGEDDEEGEDEGENGEEGEEEGEEG